MTTRTTARPTPPGRRPVSPRPAFGRLLAAEWIKLWSLRSTDGVLAVGALVTLGITINSARSNVDLISRSVAARGTDEQRLFIDPMHAAFVSEAFQILVVVACSIGALMLSGEYGSGLIRATFAAVPDRRAVVAAKLAVVTAVMTGYGTVIAATSFGVTQAIYHQHRIGLSIGDPGALRAVAASALLAPLGAVVGMAFGALIRHSAGTIVAAIVTLLLVPALFRGETYRWVAEIGNALPLTAWDALTANPAKPPPVLPKYPETITEAWIVLGVWAAVAAAAAVTLVHRRDL
ncbi:MAG: ABC transporter permease [Hamadaea sp.]|nr:ABC transporter permease [Hamadaea sp.]